MEIISLDKVDSTNLYSKKNLEHIKDRTIVTAQTQTSGRGRLERKWVDLGAENLYMTFVLKPTDTYNEIYSNLTQYLSVCLVKVLESYNVNADIKWPNDVLVNNKKIAGILCETVVHGNSFKGLALGIGVNLNASNEALSQIDKPASALNLETSFHVNKTDFLNKLSEEFFNNYDEFLEKGFELIKHDYINYSNYLDKEICVQLFNEKKSGIAKSITDTGELVLQSEGKELILTIGDIL